VLASGRKLKQFSITWSSRNETECNTDGAWFNGERSGCTCRRSTYEIVNNGHTIQVNPASGGSIKLPDGEYKLLQFHFHTPSEEKIHGKNFPLVMHLVHKNDAGKLAVVAVLFKEGKENTALKPIFDNMPAKEGEKKTLNENFNAETLLPTRHGYYKYEGSLTTPPCSEEVHWQILKAETHISKEQLAAFKKLYPMNARPVQPLNDRTVQVSE
jgi:carbonic anhydrase